MTPSWMTRRRLLACIAAGVQMMPALGVAARFVPGATSGAYDSASSLPPALKSSWQRIGERYLAKTPEENDRAVLAARLPDGAADFVMKGTNAEAVTAALRARRTREFGVGDTVVVEGWLLARSEARLCALAALSA